MVSRINTRNRIGNEDSNTGQEIEGISCPVPNQLETVKASSQWT